MLTKIMLLSFVGGVFLVTGLLNPTVYIFDAIGMMLGVIIAYYAILYHHV